MNPLATEDAFFHEDLLTTQLLFIRSAMPKPTVIAIFP